MINFKNTCQNIKQFFFLLFNPKERLIHKVNKKLEKEVKKEFKSRGKLKKEINAFVGKHYGVGISDFIPYKGSNPAEIYGSVLCVYGEQMKNLSLELRRDLTWKR